MYLFLLEHQNIIIQDHDQGREKENASQTMKEENTGAGAEAKRQEDMNPKISPLRNTSLRNIMTKNILPIKEESDPIHLKMVRTDTNAKKGSHQEAKVTQDLGPGKGVIVVEAGSGRSLDLGVGSGRSHDPEAGRGKNHDPEAGKENVGYDPVPAHDPDTGIGVEAGVGQGAEVETERRELKSQEDLAEV